MCILPQQINEEIKEHREISVMDTFLTAVEQGNSQAVVSFLQQKKVNINAACGKDEWTPLIAAAYQGYDHIISILLEYGADINIGIGDNNIQAIDYALGAPGNSGLKAALLLYCNGATSGANHRFRVTQRSERDLAFFIASCYKELSFSDAHYQQKIHWLKSCCNIAYKEYVPYLLAYDWSHNRSAHAQALLTMVCNNAMADTYKDGNLYHLDIVARAIAYMVRPEKEQFNYLFSLMFSNDSVGIIQKSNEKYKFSAYAQAIACYKTCMLRQHRLWESSKRRKFVDCVIV